MSAGAPVHSPGTPRRDRALSLDGAVLPGAVWFRAEDKPVANRHRAAALCSGVRSRAGTSNDQGARPNCRWTISGCCFRTISMCFPICAAWPSPRFRRSMLLAIGYPIAYGMARLPQQWQAVAMMLVIVPFWTSFLIRIYAWINILQHDGLLNQIAAGAASGLAAGGLALDRHCDVSRHRLLLSAVHDPAALRDAGENGSGAAGSRRRPWRFAAAVVLAGDFSAVAAGRRRRRVAVLHSRSSANSSFPICWPDPVR